VLINTEYMRSTRFGQSTYPVVAYTHFFLKINMGLTISKYVLVLYGE